MARQILTDPDERIKMLIRIEDDWRRDTQAREEWLRDKEVWLMMYNNVPPPSTSKYEGDPNFVVPVIMTTKETLHSRIYNTLFGMDKIVQGRPYGKTSADKLKKVTEFMDWETQVEMKFPEVADDWIGDILTFGISPLWIRWHRETRRDKRIETFPANAPPMYPAMKEVFQELKVPIEEGAPSDKAYIDLLFDDATIKPMDSGAYVVQYPENDVIKTVEVFIDRAMAETEGIVEVEILETITIYDAPKASVVDIEDFIMPPGSPDVQSAPHLFHRRYMSYDDIAQMVDRKIYDIGEDDMVRLKGLSEVRAASTTDNNLDDRLKTVRHDIEGVESQEVNRDLFEVVDAYYKIDIDDDGFDESIIFTVIPEHRIWCSGQYLSVLYPHSFRPFVGGRIVPRTNQWEGIGIPEMVAPFQEELSAIFNAKMRKDDFTSTPWGGYKPASGMTSRTIKIEPGMLIPMDNPATDMNIITLPASTIADVGNINLLLQFMQQLTGVSDMASGTFGSRPNAPRTFGATAAILQEGNIRFNTYIMRLQRSLSEVFEQIHALNNVYMPKSKEFFVMGENQPQVIDRDHLRGRYNFQLTTNTQNTNKAVMRDFATFVYQNLLANPLIASNVGALYKLAKLFAEAHEIRNFSEILPEPPESQQRPPMDQLQEIALISQGEGIDVLPTDDDQQHIELMMSFLESEAFVDFPREFTPLLMLHLEKHNKQASLKQQGGGGGGGGIPGVQPGAEGFQGFQGGEEAPLGPQAQSPEQAVPQ